MALIEDWATKNNKLTSNIGIADRFFLNKDGKRDVIIGFEDGLDRIDLSHYGVTFADLTIVDKNNGSGVRIKIGKEKLFIKDANASDFDASDFIFSAPAGASPPGPFAVQSDTNKKKEVLVGTTGADQFVFVDDNKRDILRDFTDGQDIIDLTAFGVTFDDLKIVNKPKSNDVRIIVEGEKIQVKDATASDFTADDFLF